MPSLKHLIDGLFRSQVNPPLANRAKLLELLTYCFNADELRELCFDLGVDYDSLPGEGKTDKARELVWFFVNPKRKRDLDELIRVCNRLRPKAPWNIPSSPRYEPYGLYTLAELHKLLTEQFDESQLRELCKSVGVDYQRLPYAEEGGAARELVMYLARRERVAELIEYCSRRRPAVPWASALAPAQLERPVADATLQSADAAVHGDYPLRADVTELREALTVHFAVRELRDLCFELGVDYDRLPGEGKERELVSYIQRRGRLSELAAAIHRMRPDIQ
jgi:Effector-associated domain 7